MGGGSVGPGTTVWMLWMSSLQKLLILNLTETVAQLCLENVVSAGFQAATLALKSL